GPAVIRRTIAHGCASGAMRENGWRRSRKDHSGLLASRPPQPRRNAPLPMATSLLALIDDIATLLDDVAVMTKVAARQGMAAADDVAAMTQMAAKKTAGVLGDDLALNAQQV